MKFIILASTFSVYCSLVVWCLSIRKKKEADDVVKRSSEILFLYWERGGVEPAKTLPHERDV